MDQIPSEIWTYIFSHACTDTGFTGLSLSLVSRFFHEAVQPVKLQSVALFGAQSIVSFDSSVLTLPASLRRVRYLLISFRSLPRPSAFDSAKPDRNKQREAEKVMIGAIQRIIEAVAEGVEILELYIPSQTFENDDRYIYLQRPIPLIPFPRLTDLTTNNYPLQRSHGPFRTPDPPLYPKLRRWHLTEEWSPVKYGEMIDYISKLAPYLALLRISGVGGISSLGGTLSIGLGLEYRSRYPRSADARIGALPPSVEKVYVQPSSDPNMGTCGGDANEDPYDGIIAELEEINRLGDERFVLLKACKRLQEREMGTTAADWEAAIKGEVGCWSLGDKLPCNGRIESEQLGPGDDNYSW